MVDILYLADFNGALIYLGLSRYTWGRNVGESSLKYTLLIKY